MKLYESLEITEKPLIKLKEWLEEAIFVGTALPHAMNLATVGLKGRPSSRMVLMKSLSDNGLVFFTDYSSKKGKQLEHNQYASCTFWWPATDKQIRIEGCCNKISNTDSDKYFESRPWGSKISAAVSMQSEVIETYDSLVKESIRYEEENRKKEIRRPERWGGFILQPQRIEFWENQSNRLHKRELFELISNDWKESLLSP